uniref:Reverse transcriptase domain-containing protein n=1 Tax=Trichuris muris TaxID=70415 RepID=A0A5S6QNI1_TRIMR
MLKPLTGKRYSHTENSASFATEIRTLEIDNEDILVSYDVKDLFTSIPLDITYSLIVDTLSKDSLLKDRTKLNPIHLTQLVKFCMKEGNFFHWKGTFFSQKRGAPMGSPLSPIVAEIFMEHLEEKAFPSGIAEYNLKLFKRYVDDIFAIVKKGHKDELLNHLNSLFPHDIQFTIEKESGGRLPFLDVLIIKDGHKLKTTVYRKPTNSGKYLNFYSNHSKNVKVGIVTGMVDRALKLCNKEFLQGEFGFIRETLRKNGFPIMFTEACIKKRLNKLNNGFSRNTENPTSDTKLILPYYPFLGEKLQKIAHTLGVTLAFKSHHNLRSILRSDKTKIPDEQKTGVVYMIQCGCGARYIGETGHTMHRRFQQHLGALQKYRTAESRERGESPRRRGRRQINDTSRVKQDAINTCAVVEHAVNCPQPDDRIKVSKLAIETDYRLRKTKEAFLIRHNECINRDEGEDISDIWSTVATHTNYYRLTNETT